MKKFKKMLAGLLGAAMVLTSFGTPAWADGAARPNLPTIDTTQKGTLTINKYEGTDENTSNDKPLAGVEFTIWKVADIEQDTSPSSNVGFKFVPVSTLKSLTAEDFKSDKTDADKYTKEIYDKVLAKLNKNDVLLDAYSGVGTIGLYLSKKVKQVISVENNRQSINAAIANAKVNHISNDTFILDDATNFITNVDKKSLKIDVLVMDPPRTGSTIEFLKATITLSPRQIIYVSCGPDTLVRDLKYLLRGGYKIDYVHCVDMFCWTNHIETVVLLSK